MANGPETVRVGIAGYGLVGARRRRFIDEHPRMRVVAVCDQRFEAPGRGEDGVVQLTDYHGLLEQDLDAVFVSLPNYLAAEVTAAALERGLHVFCEKPPGRDVADVLAVREVEARHPELRLMYGFNHRFHDSVRDAQQLVASGELGELVDMKGVYGKSKMVNFDKEWRTERAQSGGGILLDQGIHMVDMMRLFGGEFDEVHSIVSNAYWHHEVEDNAYALMRSPEGVVAMLHSSATQWRHRFNLDITLTRGSIVLSGILSSTKSYGAETITVIFKGEDDGGDPREQKTSYNADNSWRDEVFAFADAVLGHGDAGHGSSLDALRTMQLVYRIYGADEDWSSRWGLTPSASELTA